MIPLVILQLIGTISPFSNGLEKMAASGMMMLLIRELRRAISQSSSGL